MRRQSHSGEKMSEASEACNCSPVASQGARGPQYLSHSVSVCYALILHCYSPISPSQIGNFCLGFHQSAICQSINFVCWRLYPCVSSPVWDPEDNIWDSVLSIMKVLETEPRPLGLVINKGLCQLSTSGWPCLIL